jgi:hypothetical protein
VKRKLNLGEWGLKSEQLYTPEALTFWLQHDPDTFIQIISREVRDEMSIVFECVKMISENSEATGVKLSDSLTVKEVTDVILQHKAKLMDITETAWRYAIATKSKGDPEAG